MYAAILILGALGHAILWIGLVNRIHGLGIHRHWVDALTMICGLLCAALPVAALYVFYSQGSLAADTLAAAIVWDYLSLAAILCVAACLQRWWWHVHPERRGALSANHTTRLNLAESSKQPLAARGIPRLLVGLPGNEVLSICIQEKQLEIPRLKPAFEGLRIVHISDLHMSGRILKPYFERVVEEVNRCQADLVLITGDLIERAECLDWVPETFGRLEARDGVYFVLGNHDRHVPKDQILTAMMDAGAVHLGGACRELTVRNTPIVLAGNELPWYGPAADLRDCPPHDPRGLPMRIVLAHTPDQFGWARANDVDLLLAGHNHGGQVCLPLLGPIVAPSFHGVRYACGTFRQDNTVLHVCRGTASLTPVRWNCPPEIAVLTLRAPGNAV